MVDGGGVRDLRSKANTHTGGEVGGAHSDNSGWRVQLRRSVRTMSYAEGAVALSGNQVTQAKSPPGVVQLAEENKGAGNAGTKKKANHRVIVVGHGGSRALGKDSTREAALGGVETALDEIVDFEVVYTSSFDVKSLQPDDYLVYLVSGNDAQKVLDLVKGVLNIKEEHEGDVLEEIAAQLNVSGGGTIPVGGKAVAFVTTDLYDNEVSGCNLADSCETVGKKLAEMIVHELGHMFGLGHGEEVMADVQEVDINEKNMKTFTDTDKETVRRNLDNHKTTPSGGA
jgi:hypothetical protein